MSRLTRGVRSLAGCAVALLLGCTFAALPVDKTLVEEDAPIFDASFRDIDPADLDLSDFWSESGAAAPGETIPIHHRTFVEIVDRVAGGVVPAIAF